MDNFNNTHLFENDETEYFSTSDKILKLSDTLAEEIILENINEQLASKLEESTMDKINYVSLFREKYSSITPDDEFYDKDYMIQSLTNLTTLVMNGLLEKYGVELGTDLDFASPAEYLKDVETLYEFLLIRHEENLIDYINSKLEKNRENYLEKYKDLIQSESNAKDLFLTQAKKKFKNEDDIVILHFLNEIIDDICDETISAYMLFDSIVNLDLFEEYNNRMSELLINYGNKIVLNNDGEAAKKYMSPLMDSSERALIRSKIWSDYIEDCELIND